MTAPDLAALVSARLCHDLISPMGAIGNGLELMQLSGTPGAAELELVNESLANALAKVRFYRIAFGPAEPHGRLALEEVDQITEAMFTGRFTASWTAQDSSQASFEWGTATWQFTDTTSPIARAPWMLQTEQSSLDLSTWQANREFH